MFAIKSEMIFVAFTLVLAGALAQADELEGTFSGVDRHFHSPIEFDDPPVDLATRSLASSRRESGRDHQSVHIPEPLLFDLVRPLGAKKGELEINTLAVFPWSARNSQTQDDPFGSGPTTLDRKGIEWAPEIEFAVMDGFAIEFEFPFEGSKLEEYKLGLQWTIGTAFDNHFIHGFQVLVEPTVEWEDWNSTLLYLAGVRIDETWSLMLMSGGRINMEGSRKSESFERLLNASLFADLSEKCTIGLESNFAAKLDGTSEFILAPQVHHALSERCQIQAGVGLGVFTEGYEESFLMRAILSR